MIKNCQVLTFNWTLGYI